MRIIEYIGNDKQLLNKEFARNDDHFYGTNIYPIKKTNVLFGNFPAFHISTVVPYPSTAYYVYSSSTGNLPASTVNVCATAFAAPVTQASWEVTTISLTSQNAYTVEWKNLFTNNSTTQEEQLDDIKSDIGSLFKGAIEETFEDGIESKFSRELIQLVTTYKQAALAIVSDIIISGHTNPEVASEALRWIGRMDHSQTYSNRLWLLESCLNSSSSKVRDGAVLGLSSMDDCNAIPYIKSAIEREHISDLRKDMKQLLEQLESMIDAVPVPTNKEEPVVQ